jgi:hypothetical protein
VAHDPDVDILVEHLERTLDLIGPGRVVDSKQAIHGIPLPFELPHQLGASHALLPHGPIKLDLERRHQRKFGPEAFMLGDVFRNLDRSRTVLPPRRTVR